MKPNATAQSNEIVLAECDHELALACRAQLDNLHCAFHISAGTQQALAYVNQHPTRIAVLAARADDSSVLPALQRWPAMPVIWAQADSDEKVPEPVSLRGLLCQHNVAQLSEHLIELTGAVPAPVIRDAASRRVFELARRVANTDATVLISGESGAGKEVLADYIHRHSARSRLPMLAINCAAIPDTMLEAELFGFERGAFTGATQARPGKLEAASGGTLLLDEVSEMAPSLQAKLLRVLQEQEVTRLGSNLSKSLDLRIIATTNRHLIEEVAAGRFRQDLYYRLSVLPLHIPSLRERTDDVLPLALRELSNRSALTSRRRFSDQAMDVLCGHNWPGNVRELGNAVARALIFSTEPVISGATMAAAIHPLPESGLLPDQNLRQTRDDAESQRILLALHSGQGNRQQAAQQLGISQRTLRYKIARMKEEGIAIPG